MKVDVAIVGGGPAGLVSAALLAQAGKRVAVVERERTLGGRSRHWRYRGHEIGLGSHLVEDPGDSLTRVCELLGVELEHSERSDSMPFWDRGGWKPIQEHYGGAAKQGLKRCIEALVETPTTSSTAGTTRRCASGWAGTRATRASSSSGRRSRCSSRSRPGRGSTRPSENLYVRKLHYELQRTAGYSFWPIGGWDEAVGGMAEAIRGLGGAIVQPATVTRVVVENRAVQGLELSDRRAARGRRRRRHRRPSGRCAAVRRRRAAVGPAGADRAAAHEPQPCLLARLLDRGQGAGDRDDRARDGLVLRHPAHRPARLHAQLHRLRPVGLAAGRVPHVRRRRLRRGRALRRPGLDRAEVPGALAGHPGHAPGGAGGAAGRSATW